MADAKQFYPLYLTRFAGSFGYITVLTLLPTYIDLLNPSGFVIGLFVAALQVASTVAIVPLGWAGDRYDKRTILLAGLIISAAAYAVFAFVDSIAGFLVARTLQGFAFVAVGMVSLALVGQLAPATARGNFIGKYNAVRMAAGILGAFGAAILYEWFGFVGVFGLLVFLMLVAFAGIYLFIEPDGTSVAGLAFRDLALNERILTLTSFRAQYAVAVTMVRQWVPIFVGVSVARGGLAAPAFLVACALAAEKVTNMVGQPFTGRLSDTSGRALFVFVGGTAYGLVALAIPFAPRLGNALGLDVHLPVVGAVAGAVAVVVVLNGLLGVADSFREPASMALFADEGTGSGITSSFGIRSLVWRPGAILAPILGGILMDTVGIDWVFFVGGAAALLGAATFLGVLSRRHGAGALTEW